MPPLALARPLPPCSPLLPVRPLPWRVSAVALAPSGLRLQVMEAMSVLQMHADTSKEGEVTG